MAGQVTLFMDGPDVSPDHVFRTVASENRLLMFSRSEGTEKTFRSVGRIVHGRRTYPGKIILGPQLFSGEKNDAAFFCQMTADKGKHVLPRHEGAAYDEIGLFCPP